MSELSASAETPLVVRSPVVSATIEKWFFRTPFNISGYRFDAVDVLVASISAAGRIGYGEAAGVYYRGDTVPAMLQQLDRLQERLDAGLSRDRLSKLLPAGGLRNALDCALWDLEAKLIGKPVWQLAGLAEPKPLLTTFTCGAEAPMTMASTAAAFVGARAIKLKLTGDDVALDAQRVGAVRDALGDVWIGVDANQGFDRTKLDALMPALVNNRVSLIEQPFPVGCDAWLDGLASPIPIAADESVQTLADLERAQTRYDVINIKLDKCGGLTEGLALAHAARTAGLDVMIGNMLGTSLAMAPAYLVGQNCDIVDLDGPTLLLRDREDPVAYADGKVSCPPLLWGYP